MRIYSFSHSVRGEKRRLTEEREGRPSLCQDVSGSELIAVPHPSGQSEQALVLYVCDGHGGRPHLRSRTGAEFAALALKYAGKTLCEKYSQADLIGGRAAEAREKLAHELVSAWRTLVKVDLQTHPPAESDWQSLGGAGQEALYGTTVLAAVVRSSGWFSFQIGDGSLAVKDHRGGWKLPLGRDEHCFLSSTTSLCDKNAQTELRFYASESLPPALICATDGLDASFGDEGRLFDFYDKLLWLYGRGGEDRPFAPCECCLEPSCLPSCREALAEEEIKSYLPILSRKGSGDDVSIALCRLTDTESDRRIRVQAKKDILWQS